MKLVKTILVLLTLVIGCGYASAQENAAQAVQKLERAWLDAYEQLDEKAMTEIVADDFTITFPEGSRQTKAQIIASIKRPRPASRPVPKFRTEDVQARVYGDTVILIGLVVTEYQRDDCEPSHDLPFASGSRPTGNQATRVFSAEHHWRGEKRRPASAHFASRKCRCSAVALSTRSVRRDGIRSRRARSELPYRHRHAPGRPRCGTSAPAGPPAEVF